MLTMLISILKTTKNNKEFIAKNLLQKILPHIQLNCNIFLNFDIKNLIS